MLQKSRQRVHAPSLALSISALTLGAFSSFMGSQIAVRGYVCPPAETSPLYNPYLVGLFLGGPLCFLAGLLLLFRARHVALWFQIVSAAISIPVVAYFFSEISNWDWHQWGWLLVEFSPTLLYIVLAMSLKRLVTTKS